MTTSPDIIEDWHVHVYFDAESRETADAVRADIAREMPGLELGRMHDKPVGPHPIGSFQVLQHRMVDMFIAHQEAFSLMQHLNLSLSAGAAGLSRLASGAKSKVGYSGKFIADQAVQLHGGMGMTDELNVGHHYKRLLLLSKLFGDEDYHLDRFVALSSKAA